MTGKQLRKFRLGRGISTDKAAKLLGVSRRTWVRWESQPKIPIYSEKHILLLWKVAYPREDI